jgi:hypothetical protein
MKPSKKVDVSPSKAPADIKKAAKPVEMIKEQKHAPKVVVEQKL